MNTDVISALSLALGLGLLIGLQRQRAGAEFGGIRTFPLVSLLGAVSGLLATQWGGLIVVAGFIGIVGVTVLGNLRLLRMQEQDFGQTTEVAALLTYAAGVLLTTEYRPYGIAVGALTAVLLQLKESMHEFAGRLTERDVQGIMRFAVVSLIVLPLVPDATYGPFNVLNPREIWWMVVLVVAMSMAGYVSYRLFGERAGAVLSGILGGMVSSTATTVAYARRVRESANATRLAALVIVIASTIAAVRVIVEVLVVAPTHALSIIPPLAAFLGWMGVISLVMSRSHPAGEGTMPEPENPAELRSALLFGAIYALVILATAAAKDYVGSEALYGVAVMSGFVDVDAITLSTARLAAAERLEETTAWQIIIIASLTNLLFKTAIATLLGSTQLLRRLLLPMGAAVAGGLALILFWP